MARPTPSVEDLFLPLSARSWGQPQKLLSIPVDLVEREAVEASRNFIRRRSILNQAQTIYG
jgi:hypothetical protein